MGIRIKKRKERPRNGPDKVDLVGLGRRIRQLRGFEMRQVEFAKLLGISQSQLSNFERGGAPPPLDVLIALSERFGKSLDWLVLGREEK